MRRTSPQWRRWTIRFAGLALVSAAAAGLAVIGVDRADAATKPAGDGKPVTYAKEVSRIIQNRCQECHRPGTAAPFALMNYPDAKKWAETVKEVVVEKRMPPWHADPRYGKFENARGLTQEETDTLLSWIDGGRPMGDDKDLPPARTYTEGWMIGKPDAVFELPKEVAVEAKGTIPYQYYSVPTNFQEDMYIQAAEARPGNRRAVHHIIVFARDPKGERGGRGGRVRGEGIFRNVVVGNAPGAVGMVLPPGVGRRIPAGAELVFQMHYTPTGKPETDRSMVGLIFCKEKPKRLAVTQPVANRDFAIPPGDANHRVEANFTFREDAMLLSLMPHMHVRGRDFEYTATYPDGKSEVLLSVPRYDFNWQNTYRFADLKRVPKGTKIHCVAHFDNSTANPANPDPTEEVRWGDQTWEEMMIGYVHYVPDRPTDEAVAEGGE